MAKGQKRSNREIKKPKKAKEPVSSAAPVGMTRGEPVSLGAQKKKKG